jgi:hypothetical protein
LLGLDLDLFLDIYNKYNNNTRIKLVMTASLCPESSPRDGCIAYLLYGNVTALHG